MIRRPPRSTRVRSSAASDVYKRQVFLLEFLHSPYLQPGYFHCNSYIPPYLQPTYLYWNSYILPSVFSVAGDSGRAGGERAARQVHRARPSESKKETLTRLTQTGESSSLDFKGLPITNFLSGAIPITSPITDLHLGRDRNSFPERASVFSVAEEAPRFSKGCQS